MIISKVVKISARETGSTQHLWKESPVSDALCCGTLFLEGEVAKDTAITSVFHDMNCNYKWIKSLSLVVMVCCGVRVIKQRCTVVGESQRPCCTDCFTVTAHHTARRS